MFLKTTVVLVVACISRYTVMVGYLIALRFWWRRFVHPIQSHKPIPKKLARKFEKKYLKVMFVQGCFKINIAYMSKFLKLIKIDWIKIKKNKFNYMHIHLKIKFCSYDRKPIRCQICPFLMNFFNIIWIKWE